MHSDVVILGGGMTGLSVAYHLGIEATLFEKEATLGGCLRSEYLGDYKLDRTGHLLHFRDPYVQRLMLEELSIDWLEFKREAEIRVLNRSVPYPIQYNLSALPDQDRLNCLMSFVNSGDQRPSLQDSFERWSRLSYGDHLHDLFFAPYNRKLWQTDLNTITAEWAERFVPMPDRDLVIRGALGMHTQDGFGYNATFNYPKLGGSQTIVNALAKRVTHPTHTGVQAVAIDPINRLCEFSDGSRIFYRSLVSTMPLPRLVGMIHKADPAIVAKAATLRHNSIFYFGLGYRIAGPPPTWHWVYVPEESFSMYRVGLLSNYSPDIAPKGSILLCVELGFPGDSARYASPDDLRERILRDLSQLNIIEPNWELEFEHHGVIDCAYVIYDDARRCVLSTILGYLRNLGIHSIGRYGAWGYGSMADALLEGRECAETLHEKYRAVARSLTS